MFSDNARRFISAYNQIDQSLRNQYDLSKSISYTEAIRKCARMNAFVKKYEDKPFNIETGHSVIKKDEDYKLRWQYRSP